jgi:hypothetical protein
MSDGSNEPLLRDTQARRLWWSNVGIGLFQLATASVMMQQAVADWKEAPVYTNFPATGDERTIANMRPVQRHLTGFSVGSMTAAFLYMSGIDHLFVTLPCVWRKYYRGVTEGRNVFRWIEYFFSASLMHAAIALLCGIFDVHLLFAVYCLTAVTMVFGALQELYGSVNDGALFNLGFIPHAANWSIIGCYFFRSVSHSSPPDFVWSILGVIFALDIAFAVVAWRHRKTEAHLTAEYRYMLLSLTSKQALAWLQFWGMQGIKRE